MSVEASPRFHSRRRSPELRQVEMSMEVNEESWEISSSVSAKRAKKLTSIVWNTFLKLPRTNNNERLKAQCQVCKAIFVADRGTTNMKRHLATHLDSRQEHGHTPFDQALYREKMSVAILKHNYPFKFVEHQGNRDIHSYLNPAIKTISRNTAKSDILKMYDREKEHLKNELSLIPGKIGLTADMWTSVALNGYMCVTAHYVDLNWKLQKRVLIFRHVPPPHSGSVLGPLLIEFLKEWGIEKKIFTLTLDNASCNNGVVDHLKEHLSLTHSLVCNGKFFHVRCANHILNLIVRAGLEKADVAILKIREGIKHIKHSEGRILKFVECIKNLGLPCSKKLRQDVTTRWNSTYQMLESAIIYQQAYVQYRLLDTDFKYGLSEEEWKRVKSIANFLKPFYEITTLFSGSEYPTANLYLPNVWKIQMLLEKEKDSSDQVMNEMATLMLRKFRKYWRSYSVILSFAIVLDPRFKLRFVKFCLTKLDSVTADSKLKKIERKLQLLFCEYLVPSTTTPVTGEQVDGRGSNDVRDGLEEFDTFENQAESGRDKTQLDLYLEEPLLDRNEYPNFDVLAYWKENRRRYPELSMMARDVLSIPITTVASESTFSIGGRVIGKFQSSILPANAEAKLCTRDWLYGQEDCSESDTDEDEIAVNLQPYLARFGSY